MGLFDKLKNITDKVNDFINDDNDDDNDEVSVIDMGSISTSPNVQLYNMGVLSDPPAPPIPVTKERMSVSIAVNGKNYGPYERATLLDMIAKGSLTPQTLVFMKGMSGWKPAGEVSKVKELFSDKLSIPDLPPVPWAESSETTLPPIEGASKVEEENILSPRLNRLITAAVADGEISDMERQVLVRNAQEEGVSMDEFVMILEARLYEQRQVLLARQKEMEHKHQMEKASVQAAAAKVAAAPIAMNENKTNTARCPHCGAPRKALATNCPECGYEYESSGHTATSSSAERLAKMLLDIEQQQKGVSDFFLDSLSGSNIYTKKATVIENFPIPNTKIDIFDLFSSCVAKAKTGMFATPVDKAYYKKSREILIKARVVVNDDQKLLDQMHELAKKYKIKA